MKSTRTFLIINTFLFVLFLGNLQASAMTCTEMAKACSDHCATMVAALNTSKDFENGFRGGCINGCIKAKSLCTENAGLTLGSVWGHPDNSPQGQFKPANHNDLDDACGVAPPEDL